MMNELLQPNQIFAGRYRIDSYLAQGGFGAVYIAEQTATELRVALKVLWPHILSSDDAVAKFQQEARIAGRVNSEHIVRVIDAGFDEATRTPFLVMELLEGEDLEKVVLRAGAMPAEQVVVCLRQTASGLDKAHGYVNRDGLAEPIVHRDLKPENLFLTHRDDGTVCIKILDFGIAKVLSSSTKVSQEVKGTPLYMAYEQGAGGAITPRTDVWALGLIAFYLLTGRCYWKAAHLPEASLTQLFGEVLSLPIVPPGERARELGIVPSWPAAFESWFLRCVNRDAHNRFASAGEAASALAVALGYPDQATTGRELGPSAAAGAAQTLASNTGPGWSASAPDSLVGTDAAVAIGRTDAALPGTRKSGGMVVAAVAGVIAIGAVAVGIALFASSRTSEAQATPESSSSVIAPASSPAPEVVTVAPTSSAPAASASAEADAAVEESPAPKTPAPPKVASPAKPPPTPTHTAPPATTGKKPGKDDLYGER